MAKKDFKKNASEMFFSATNEPEAVPSEGASETITRAEPSGFVVPKGYQLIKENKSERMQLLVRPSLKEAIKKEADAQGISMNDLINTIFEGYFERKGE